MPALPLLVAAGRVKRRKMTMMADKDLPPDEEQTEKPANGQVSEVELKPMGRVKVEHHDAPPPGPPDKKIHQRRPLPLVPPTKDEEKNQE